MHRLLAPTLLLVALAAPIAAEAGIRDRTPIIPCGPLALRPVCQVKAPEIDIGSGLAAIAVLLAGLALAYERRRDV